MSEVMDILNNRSRRFRDVDHESLKKAYQSVFSSPAGRLVLEDLCTSFTLVQNPEKTHANVADARAFNDGKRSVAIRCLNMLED